MQHLNTCWKIMSYWVTPISSKIYYKYVLPCLNLIEYIHQLSVILRTMLRNVWLPQTYWKWFRLQGVKLQVMYATDAYVRQDTFQAAVYKPSITIQVPSSHLPLSKRFKCFKCIGVQRVLVAHQTFGPYLLDLHVSLCCWGFSWPLAVRCHTAHGNKVGIPPSPRSHSPP